MTSVVIPNAGFQSGPGKLWAAIVGTALPSVAVPGSGGTVAGSKFTDTPAAAYRLVGITEGGSAFSVQVNTDTINAAEYLDPLAYKSTGREIGVEFDMMNMVDKNFQLAFNGGTVTTVSGTGATSLTKGGPPNVGSETRTMLLWESEDETERWVFYSCFQGGQVNIQNRKAPQPRTLPVQFRIEQPASGDPFNYFIAGTKGIG